MPKTTCHDDVTASVRPHVRAMEALDEISYGTEELTSSIDVPEANETPTTMTWASVAAGDSRQHINRNNLVALRSIERYGEMIFSESKSPRQRFKVVNLLSHIFYRAAQERYYSSIPEGRLSGSFGSQ